MARLEAARLELQQGLVELEALGSQLGGKLDELPLLTLAELRKEGPQLAHWAVELVTGDYSPPYLVESGIQLLRLRERQEPQQLPFDEVRPIVRDDYFKRHGQQVYVDFVASLLNEQQFHIDRLQLERLVSQHSQD